MSCPVPVRRDLHHMTSLVITTYKKLKKKETDRTFDLLLLRQGEPGTSQYIIIIITIE